MWMVAINSDCHCDVISDSPEQYRPLSREIIYVLRWRQTKIISCFSSLQFSADGAEGIDRQLRWSTRMFFICFITRSSVSDMVYLIHTPFQQLYLEVRVLFRPRP